MSTLFVLLFLVSIPILIVGMVRPKLLRLYSRKNVAIMFGSATVTLLILIGVTAPRISASTPVATNETAKATDVATSTSSVVATSTDDDVPSVVDETIAQAVLTKIATASVLVPASKSKAGDSRLYPNPTLTPGAVLTTDTTTICTKGYASSVRNVTSATKKQVYAEYGVSYPQATGAYEVDHFIPLEIGGSNDIKNLWLEPALPPPGFHQKDQFENLEHDQICSGKITPQVAQSRMTSDWYYYYEAEMEGVTPNTPTPTTQPAPVPVVQQQVTTQAVAPTQTTTTTFSGAYYTSSYYSSKYYYPASCAAWKSLSAKYLQPFDSLSALLSKYPGKILDPSC